MRHETLDAFAHSSRFTIIDPRIKLISVVLLIIMISFITDPILLGASLFVTILLLAVSSVPPGHLMKHYLVAFPFLAFASLSLHFTAGPDQAISLMVRSTTSVLLLLFVGATTPFFDLLKGLRKLGVPQLNVIMLFFLYRYLFIIWDEMERMERARIARGFVRKGNILNRHLFSGIIGTAGMILVRSYERGKRSYHSLVSRGYQGEIRTLRTLKITPLDLAFLIPFLCYSAVLGGLIMGVVG